LGCAALAFFWQSLTVHFNYGGNWTALFCIGSQYERPPELNIERPYVFQNSPGYDGAVYHYIAHDPFMQHDLLPYVDAPRYRYRRILIPLAAYTLALGRMEPPKTDAGTVSVTVPPQEGRSVEQIADAVTRAIEAALRVEGAR